MQQILEAIASPRRRKILRLVWEDERSAGDIASQLDVSWSATSQNLRVLRGAGLVSERRDGNRRLYRADRAALGPLAAALQEMWASDLATLKLAVEGSEERTTQE